MSHATQGYGIADLEALHLGDGPDDGSSDGRRYELIGGSIVMSPSPTPRHQLASFRLERLLADVAPAGHTVFHAPTDLDLPGDQRVVPDIVVVPNSSIRPSGLVLPALLVVELVSSSSVLNDLTVKPRVYAEAGIDHYWVLDTRPGHERFVAFRRAGATFETASESVAEVSMPEPLAVSISLDELLSDPT